MLAVTRTNLESGKGDIWIYDLERGTKSRLSFDEGDDYCPLWTPDGTHVTFASARQRGYQPDYYALATDATVIFPWDRKIFEGDELIVNPRYEGVIDD